MKRVLLTGPVERLDEYARAASDAGWEAIRHPLLRIEPVPVDRAEFEGPSFDWICLTSSNALAYLESARDSFPSLRATPCAVVGERTADRVRALGFAVELEPAPDAASLAESLQARARPGARVLWPRGSLSDDLAHALRRVGIAVVDPVAYATSAIPSQGAAAPPAAEAVFFASPSAVRVWHDLPVEDERRIAIAVGATTFDALLQETQVRFFDTISLPQPTPEALGNVLAHLDLEISP